MNDIICCLAGTMILKMKLPIVARIAASKVVIMYNEIILTNLEPKFLPAFDNALVISTNTKTGAIALSAPAKSVPNTPIKVALGTSNAKMIPIPRPIATRAINGILTIPLPIALKKLPIVDKKLFVEFAINVPFLLNIF